MTLSHNNAAQCHETEHAVPRQPDLPGLSTPRYSSHHKYQAAAWIVPFACQQPLLELLAFHFVRWLEAARVARNDEQESSRGFRSMVVRATDG